MHRFTFILISMLFVFSCTDDPTSSNGGNFETGTVSDIDGNNYKTVKIGDQWWMSENLKVTRYRNGNSIPNVTIDSDWENLSTGAYVAYNHDKVLADTYGLLYNWYAVDDSRNIAPEGWHVPTDEEFSALENYLIANGYNWDGSTSGNKIGKSMASKTGWNSSSEAGDVGNDMSTNNTSGFTALAGGKRSLSGLFHSIGYYARYWSSTEGSSSDALRLLLGYGYSAVYRSSLDKRTGISVRLIRD